MFEPATIDNNEWSRIYDQNSESYYYWNLATYEVSWVPPSGFDPIVAAKRERDAAGLSLGESGGLGLLIATRKIQAVFRSRQARKMLQAWSHVWDPAKQTYYYWNTETFEVTWEAPPGYSKSNAAKREREAAGLSLSDSGGLGLLIATRKIQAVYRKKKARERSRLFNAEQAAIANGYYCASLWIRMDDPGSGFPYWYHRDTHECTWTNPEPIPLKRDGNDNDRTIFYPKRLVLLLIAPYMDATTGPLKLVSKHLMDSIRGIQCIQTKKIISNLNLSAFIQCGSLMAMRIRGQEECEAVSPVLNALRVASGGMYPIPHLQNKMEKFKLSKDLVLYRGNRRWLQKNRVGLISNLNDVVWLSSALARVDELKVCLEQSLQGIQLRDINSNAADLHAYFRCMFDLQEQKEKALREKAVMQVLDDTVNRVVVEKMVVEMVDKVVKEGTEETQQEKETITEGKSAVQ